MPVDFSRNTLILQLSVPDSIFSLTKYQPSVNKGVVVARGY
jgi:hypothetical protein